MGFLNKIEWLFWAIAGTLAIIGAFGMLIKGFYLVYLDFSNIKLVLSTELFYAIISFELYQMSRIRLEKRSHKIVLYHFIFMATLTLGREIFLLHNLDIFIIISFSIMVGVYALFWAWKAKTDKESPQL